MPQAYDRFKQSLHGYHQQMARSDAYLQVSPQELRAAELALLDVQMKEVQTLGSLLSGSGKKPAPPKLSLKSEMAPRPAPDVSVEALKVHELLQRKSEPVATSLAQHFMQESGGSEFLSSPSAEGLGDDFYVVLGMAQNIDHLVLRVDKGAPLRARFAVPENYEERLSDFSQRLDQWPGQFPQTQKLLADMSAAIKDQQLVSGLKEALREQTNLSAPAK